VLLATNCFNCNIAISVSSIALGICQNCKAILKNAKAISVANDEIGIASQNIIQGWLIKSVAINNYGLPNAPSRVLYRVVDGLRVSISSFPPKWNYFHRPVTEDSIEFPDVSFKGNLSSLQAYILYVTVVKALMNWSGNFRDF
jgi:hypothetical protein